MLYILCIATVGVGAGVTAVLAALAAFVHWVRAATGKRRAVYVAATLGLLLFLYTMFFTEL